MSREYGKVSPQFWIGDTGKQLRGDPEAQLLALYLVSNPHANMIGLYYLPLMYAAHETGLPLEGASEALRRLSEGGFCSVDASNDMVFVREMAKWQIAPELKGKDKRIKGVENELSRVPKTPLLLEFYERYSHCFNLSLPCPFKGPLKPLRSQEQEQEQDKEQDKEESSLRSDSCPETCCTSSGPKADDHPALCPVGENQSQTFLIFPCDGAQGEWKCTVADVSHWRERFPALDVEQELRTALSWIESNPSRRKTAAGMRRFVTNWLSRTQNEGRGRKNANTGPDMDMLKRQAKKYHNTDGDYGLAKWLETLDLDDVKKQELCKCCGTNLKDLQKTASSTL